ncbi:MAG: ComEC/Rec2 family competence protein [Candidatus Methylomirabilia bacterium]
MPLVPLALAFCAGVMGAAWVRPDSVLLLSLGAGLSLAGACALQLGRPGLATSLLLLLVALLGLLRAAPPRLPPDHLAHLRLPATVILEGRLAKEPIPYAPDRTRLLIEAEGVKQDGGQLRPARGRAQVTLYGEPPGLTTGQRIRGVFRLGKPVGFRNPGGFDYPAYLARRGIFLVGSGRAGQLRALTSEDPRWTVRVRRWALATFHHHLPLRSGALLAGLLLGERAELPRSADEAFRRAGVYHILAVSGFHVALIASTVFLTLSLLRIPRRVVAIIAGLTVVAYASVIGGRPSVVRAAVMGVLLLVGLMLEHEVNVLNSLALAALAILLWRPGDLWEPGFQLSFGATTGIVSLAPGILAGLKQRGWPRWLAAGIAVSASAQLAVTPIMLAHFNQLSLIGVAANLIVVPLAALAMTVGLGALLLSAASEAFGDLLFQSVWLILLALRLAVHGAAELPGAMVHLPAPHWSVVAAFYGLLALLASPGRRTRAFSLAGPSHAHPWQARSEPLRFKRRGWVAAGILALWVGAASLWPWVKPAEGRLRVTILDVGQGDAIFIELPDGKRLLIDGGSGGPHRFDAGERVIAPFLWNRAVRQLDVVAMTHSDPDHAGGLSAVLRHFTVGEFWKTGIWDAGGAELRALARRSGVRRRFLRQGEQIRLGPVSVSVLHPPATPLQGSPRGPSSDDNNNSLVLRLEWKLASFLFAGDLEREGEEALVTSGEPVRHLVLKVAHHGSRFSTTERFLASAHPAFAVITVGARNPFGHPTPETLKRLRSRGVRLFRTDQDGAVIFETDGRELSVTRWATGETEQWRLAPGMAPRRR